MCLLTFFKVLMNLKCLKAIMILYLMLYIKFVALKRMNNSHIKIEIFYAKSSFANVIYNASCLKIANAIKTFSCN